MTISINLVRFQSRFRRRDVSEISTPGFRKFGIYTITCYAFNFKIELIRDVFEERRLGSRNILSSAKQQNHVIANPIHASRKKKK